jgi:putative transposase
MADELGPKDHAEAIAIFRAQVIGPLLCRELSRGELAAALEELSQERFRPPGALERSFSVSTLERWYYAYKAGGLEALRPKGRQRGFALELSEEQRELVCAIRREHRSASVPLIARTLVKDGRLPEGRVSLPTLRRLFAARGLDRIGLRESKSRLRLRWEAERPNALWHADVCHGPSLRQHGRSVPLRVHAILDDASRYVPAIDACPTEREAEMLALLVKAVGAHGKPDGFYLDRGPTYTGGALATACARLGIALVHAKPRDPQARGKMERFFRTLREGCLDHLRDVASYHDIRVRLLAFLDQHYHTSPHASLMGKSPLEVYERERKVAEVSDEELRDALTVRGRRRVRRDGTISVAGADFELDQGFLAGRVVTVARALVDPSAAPWVEHEDQRYELHRVDPKANARRSRKSGRPARGIDAIPFDPPGVLLDEALGRNPKPKREE